MRAAALLLLLPLAGCGAAPEYGCQVVHTYPHDTKAFTEGLEFRGGFLYESTGLEGQSTLSKIKLETGQVVQQIHLEPAIFGEGITIINERIVQLTYKTEVGYVYDQPSMKRQRTFSYKGEGWSLTNDGSQIYMDDGSAQIRVWDPVTLREKRRFTVRDGVMPVLRLNELEWIRGEIWANVWQTTRIARISPGDGKVVGWIDCPDLLSAAETGGVDVMNGIAYDSFGDRVFVTGKLWPKIFEIKVVKKNGR
jgi:glutaminyl-peptide cyclotransferase